MIAIEATIVATAMPQIVGQLGGLQLYSWVFSSFLLTQTATTVVFGKLADLYGRKHVMLVGIAIFLAGSIAVRLRLVDASLIAFRLVQGLGAGAIQPIAMTVVGDLYPAHERGKVQGWLASVWGAVGGARAARRRADHPAFQLGLDLLDQRAGRRRSPRRGSGPVPARGASRHRGAASTLAGAACSRSRSPRSWPLLTEWRPRAGSSAAGRRGLRAVERRAVRAARSGARPSR